MQAEKYPRLHKGSIFEKTSKKTLGERRFQPRKRNPDRLWSNRKEVLLNGQQPPVLGFGDLRKIQATERIGEKSLGI